ncbi:phage major capsid protein [Micromonospora globbae]|uniref:Phage major capsid protein n=1 Tax=Micromonospora globbae TaxID=1894969 RepID=A0A420F1K5_9ACTN|nr:phage major capsid protein [Micromonospora globbae]RKF26854.1 phage major capsid protein [Micromonospora globbae]
MAYLNDSQIISRSENEAIELPEQVASDVVKATANTSVVARLARRINMGSKSYRQPVISGLPTAYWVNGDTGLKGHTTVKFGDTTLVAEAMATLVVVPDEFIDDSGVPIWSECKTLIAEAFGRKLDDAALWGLNAPASWTDSVYGSAVAAGNYVDRPASDAPDYGVDIANAAKLVSSDGFSVSGFAVRPGLRWELLGQRDLNGSPVFQQLAGTDGMPAETIYNLPAVESRNGAWNNDVSVIAGDWDKALFGVRQDITATIHTDAVISDESGNVVFNAMQQDSKIMRVVMRVGFAIANPQTQLNTTSARSPFALVLNEGTAAS